MVEKYVAKLTPVFAITTTGNIKIGLGFGIA